MRKATGQARGKIILSGEYAVGFGYPGIAIPAPVSLTATFEPTQKYPMEIFWPEVEGTPWIPYLQKIIDLCIEHGAPYAGTLTIQNTIPLGRGMGSSTALVIAVTRCLFHNPPLPFKGEGKGEGLKKIAAAIENSLNPGHSGLDFEVIWNECPILFRKGKPSNPISVTINQLIVTPQEFCLIDTGKPDQSTPELVAWIKEKINIPSPSGGGSGRGGNKKGGIMEALQAIGHCTDRLVTLLQETCHPERSRRALYEIFRIHHRAQVALGIVPKKVQTLIEEIEKTGGVAKVIGAGGRSGGAGMVLALHINTSMIEHMAKRHGFLTIMQPLPLTTMG